MMILARDSRRFCGSVLFNEAEHKYTLNGEKLSGVTGAISKRLNLHYDKGEEVMTERLDEGKYVHKSVQDWVSSSEKPKNCAIKAEWIMKKLESIYKDRKAIVFSEVLVSDFKKYASAIDLLVEIIGDKGGIIGYDLYDIKTGNVNPEYLSWQLGIYKAFIKPFIADVPVRCYCIASKIEQVFEVLPYEDALRCLE